MLLTKAYETWLFLAFEDCIVSMLLLFPFISHLSFVGYSRWHSCGGKEGGFPCSHLSGLALFHFFLVAASCALPHPVLVDCKETENIMGLLLKASPSSCFPLGIFRVLLKSPHMLQDQMHL